VPLIGWHHGQLFSWPAPYSSPDFDMSCIRMRIIYSITYFCIMLQLSGTVVWFFPSCYNIISVDFYLNVQHTLLHVLVGFAMCRCSIHKHQIARHQF